ncbi:DNA-binding GntR family transcriptional regulator [Devosia subaequoris]|uniref:DNA-binding GntR family transcriptional regulator n=1 Tax=Devosia subaequoris TaxID=395930 RepID=A0A7W6NCN4_9HYPH|nr:GntR family transcriptional regulator [Devosia subaequoris]MBB4053844.1 DNA-binding GntR family transcriptional regulator [Devosia subaequoris]MCP1211137.1 GntR family transcriptional regulator [Devosia subaequoris]
MNSLTDIRRPPALTEEVYARLFEQLITHSIAPGTKLSVDALSRSLNVSQTPIREALARLEAQGLVVKIHLVGYRVAERIEPDRLEQIYEFRLLTEPHMAALAAERTSEPSRRELLVQCQRMKSDCTSDTPEDYARFSRLDEAFHRAIAVGSGNKVIEDALSALHVHVHLFRMSQPPTAVFDAIEEHSQIAEAIAAADPQAAAKAMRRHVLNSQRRFT